MRRIRSLRRPLHDAPEMQHLSAGIYFRLLRFVTSGGQGVSKFCDPPNEIKRSDKTCSSDGVNEGDNTGGDDDGEDPATKFPFDQPGADIVLRSTDGIDFKIHTVMVDMQIMSNPVFPLQAVLLSTPLADTYADGLPVIQTREPSPVLQLLLQRCYPGTPKTNMAWWEGEFLYAPNTISAMGAMQRYGMSHIVETLKATFMMNLYVDTLAAFCVGYSLGWFETIEDCPRALAQGTWLPDEYHPTLELLTAKEYYSLLEYWHTYQERVYAVHEQVWSKKNDAWWDERWDDFHGWSGDFVRGPVMEAEIHKALEAKERGIPYAFSMKTVVKQSEMMMSQARQIEQEVRVASMDLMHGTY